MQKLPELPSRPAELIELEGRLSAIRGQRREVEQELRRIEDELWSAKQSGDENLDFAAEQMVAGEMEPTARSVAPKRIAELRDRLEILIRADRKATERTAEQRARHNRNIAAAWRPQHKQAAQRIARALRELVSANEQEERVRDKAPGGHLPPMNFPSLGQLGAAGGSAKFWMEHAARHGYLADEDEDVFPAAAL